MTKEVEGYLNSAIDHYKSLFNLPSYGILVLTLFILTCIGEGLTFFIINPELILSGVAFGVLTLLLPCIGSDLIIETIMKDDPLLNLRRYTGLSLFSIIIWILVSLVGGALTSINVAFVPFWKALLLGFPLVVSFRFLVINTTSSLTFGKRIMIIFFQPLLCLGAFGLFFPILNITALFFTSLATALLLFAATIFFLIIDSYGKESIGIGTIGLFKAFLNTWAEGLSSVLEEKFEKIGEETDVYVDLMSFKSNEKLTSMMVVPILHPGPFRNVGSSRIPHDIQEGLFTKTGAIVCVPHGPAGHELDLASIEQSEKVVKKIVGAISVEEFVTDATPLVRVAKDNFKASCQIFGKHALITLTSSPKSTEDLPSTLGDNITKVSMEWKLNGVTVVDAHNSVEQGFTILSQEDIMILQECAKEAIKKAVNQKKYSFECGASKNVPIEFSIENGIGPGGIVALVFKIADEMFAYITIDGNNMIRGLREKILEAILKLGIIDGEILTTDTHIVNAVGPSKRGYHPVGEAIDQEKLLYYIEKATKEAISNLDQAEMSFNRVKIEKVKVLGEKNILEITKLVDRVIGKIKILSVAIFVPAISVVTIMLILFKSL